MEVLYTAVTVGEAATSARRTAVYRITLNFMSNPYWRDERHCVHAGSAKTVFEPIPHCRLTEPSKFLVAK